ncbi:amino acid permease, partial [Pseudomonas aeruginosa]|nr:amino acid permease [Pseudomonas aeruginosa]
ILLGALIGGSVYDGSSYFMYLAHPSPAFAHVDGAGFGIARMTGGDLFFAVGQAGITIALFAAGMSFQASVGRLRYVLGRDKQLPWTPVGAPPPPYKVSAFTIRSR